MLAHWSPMMPLVDHPYPNPAQENGKGNSSHSFKQGTSLTNHVQRKEEDVLHTDGLAWKEREWGARATPRLKERLVRVGAGA